jgi:hypothetical protein
VTDNNIYGGLKWDFNGGINPEAVIGFRSARVNPSSYTNGGDISISAKFIDKFQLGKIRAKYFSGINTAQAELSGGYDFTKGLFTGVSINVPYVNLGIDYLINAKESPFESYAMIHTIGKYKKKPSVGGGCGPDHLTGNGLPDDPLDPHSWFPNDGKCYQYQNFPP